ncbi:hypothetical protein ncot_00710 [Nocardioides sp. JQ2195]|uniref:hypothetical protein n=1 Tax=Nocardioides sp. JQ2195 TaxID=2592334 RepID=UPI00143E2F3D|nr:hypothetical protein [Nocardioides sp. JQ2195]QIX25268.1 hypothetical protein ncot_00710 [Nocardioides sp. JQ2195]
MHRRRLIAHTTTVGLALSALVLSGCGSTGAADGPAGRIGAAATGAPLHPDEPLDDEQLATVLLKVDELGSDYAEDTERSDDPARDCLHELLDVTNFGLAEPESHDDAEFFGTETHNQGETVLSSVASYQNETAAESTYDDYREHVDECTRVTFTRDKRRWDLRMSHDEDLAVDAEEQLNLHIDGSMTWKQNTYEVTGKYSLVRSQNDVVGLALIAVDAAQPPSRTVDPMLVRSANRLIDLNW